MQGLEASNAGQAGRSPIRRTGRDGGLKRHPASDYVGLQVRTARRLAGLSREAAAAVLDIGVEALVACEHGQRELTLSELGRFAAYVEKPLAWFRAMPAGLVAHPTPDAGRPAVLLVDDSSDTLLVLGAFLEGAGIRVIRATSGDEALGIIASDKLLHAIVTDNIMPGLSGVDLLLQAAHLRPDLPGLIVTGCAADANGLGELPRKVGILSKPFRRQEFVDLVRGMTAVVSQRSESNDLVH